MRPLSLLLGLFLRFVVSDLLWGCEPNCPPISGTRPQLVNGISWNETWFVAENYKESSSILVKNLTESLFGVGSYGLIILESGSDFSVLWLMSSASNVVGVTGLISSKTPEDNFILISPGLSTIDSTQYNLTIRGMVIASPSASISFKLKTASPNCSSAGLIFAVFPWDSLGGQTNIDVSFLVPSQCSNCLNLPLSEKIVRICPREIGSTTRMTLPARETTTSSITVASTTTSPTTQPLLTSTLSTTSPTTEVTTAPSTTTTPGTTTETTTTTVSTTTEVATTVASTVSSTTAEATISPIESTTIGEESTPTVAMDFSTPLDSTPTTSEPSTTPQEVATEGQANFHNNLKGIRVTLVGAPIGILDCSSFILDLSLFGYQPSCVGDGRGVDVFFGIGAKLQLGDRIAAGNLQISVGKASFPVGFAPPLKNIQIRPNFVVDYKNKLMECESEVQFGVRQIAGVGDREPTFLWKRIDGYELIAALEEARDKRFVTIPTKIIMLHPDMNMTISVTVCNFVQECTTSEKMSVQVVNSTQSFAIAIEGIPEVVYPSVVLKLNALPILWSCNQSSLGIAAQYNWEVNGSTLYDSSYRIPAFKYSVNDSIPVVLQATYKDPKNGQFYVAEVRQRITYSAEPLILSIDSASKIHPFDAVLTIDGSASRDPNSMNSVISNSWKCLNLTSNTTCSLPRINYNSAIFQLNGGYLEKGGKFLFTNTVVSSLGQTGTLSCLVEVSSAMLPSVEFVPMIRQKESTHDYIRLLALISSEDSPTNVTWEVIKSPGYGFFMLKDFLSDNNIHFNLNLNGRKMLTSLTIPPKGDLWNGLSPGSRYLLRVKASNPRGSTSADIVLITQDELPQGEIEILPKENITGLRSDITFRLGDGWNSLDFPVFYRFGYKMLMDHNETSIEWLPHTSSSSITLVLPSGGENCSCSKRIGFTALVEVCDHDEACRITESEEFHVEEPKNVSLAINEVVQKINSDILNGNILDAIQKIWAIELELCQARIETDIADRSVLALLRSLTSQSDIDEWREVVEAAAHLLPSVSDEVLLEVQPVLQRYRSKLGLTFVTRKKRDTSMVSLTNNTITTEKDASYLLEMYDVLIYRNQKFVDAILANIDDFLANFCLQLDEQSTRIMKAKGINYTQIQAQAVNPNKDDFLNSTWKTAGDVALLTFTNTFQQYFSEWKCGNNLFCHHTCLATARLDSKAFEVNVQLNDYFYYELAPVDANRSVSSLYKVSIVDPTTGRSVTQMATLQPFYSIRIPLTDYQIAGYYACFIYTDASPPWSSAFCTANNYAIKISGIYYMTCNCSASGYIGVYSQTPPPPPHIPDHNQVLFTFILNTTNTISEAQKLQLQNSFAATGQLSRLKNFVFDVNNSSQIMVNVTLRPPFKANQITSAYAVQAILRVVDPQSGFTAYETIRILSSSYQIILRDLVGDGNARKIIIRIDKSYFQVVGNISDTLASKWTDSMASALRISPYRFKNPAIFMGIMFNFTITQPFEEEKFPLSAEEISLMLVEDTSYGELQLQSAIGESILIPPIQPDHDIVELRVQRQTNPLVVILLVGILSGILLTSLYIGGAIVVKVKTDRCIEEERRRVVMANSTEAPPQYENAVPDGVVRARHR